MQFFCRLLCWLLSLRVDGIIGLRLVDVTIFVWMQVWNSKTGEEGW